MNLVKVVDVVEAVGEGLELEDGTTGFWERGTSSVAAALLERLGLSSTVEGF